MRNIITAVIAVLLVFTVFFTSTTHAERPDDAGLLPEKLLSGLQLRGTLFTDSLSPLAIIEYANSGQVMIHELGDSVEGFKIVKISRGEVIMSSAGRQFTLSFPDGGVLQPMVFAANEGKWYNIKTEGNTIVTDRATVAGAILRIKDIMKDVQVGPYSENGKKSGMAVAKLDEKGILQEIGVKQGDIIKSVNGLPINNPYQVINAYRRLKDKSELRVEIIRNASPLVLNYRIEK
ncbi:MAG: PDZ domain-containing protein [Candidatus Omnitrophica bacterium]|nr:PDZ domain-containing protein [Candidatus Omnitrophota bacterium]